MPTNFFKGKSGHMTIITSNNTGELVWNPADLFIAAILYIITVFTLTAAEYFIDLISNINFFPKALKNDYLHILSISVPLMHLINKYPLTSEEYGFNKKNVFKVIFWGLVCAAIISGGNIINIYTPVNSIGRNDYVSISDGKLSFYMFIITSILIIPIFEELLFRGCIYRILKNRYNIYIAVILTSLVFALGHSDITFALFSFVLIAGYEFTKCLGTSIIAHILWNTMFYVRLYINGGT